MITNIDLQCDRYDFLISEKTENSTNTKKKKSKKKKKGK